MWSLVLINEREVPSRLSALETCIKEEIPSVQAAPGDTWTRLEGEAKGHSLLSWSGTVCHTFSHSTASNSLTKISRNTDEIKYCSLPSGLSKGGS